MQTKITACANGGYKVSIGASIGSRPAGFCPGYIMGGWVETASAHFDTLKQAKEYAELHAE